MRSETDPGCLNASREKLRGVLEGDSPWTVDYMLAGGIVLRKTIDLEAGWELVWKTNPACSQSYAPAASPSG